MEGQLTLSCDGTCHYYIFVEASNGELWGGADHYLVDYSSYSEVAANSSATESSSSSGDDSSAAGSKII